MIEEARKYVVWHLCLGPCMFVKLRTARSTLPQRSRLSERCSPHGALPVKSTKAVQTEATWCFSGRMDAAVGTTIADRAVCQSTQTSPAAKKVHRWANTTDLDVHGSGLNVQAILSHFDTASVTREPYKQSASGFTLQWAWECSTDGILKMVLKERPGDYNGHRSLLARPTTVMQEDTAAQCDQRADVAIYFTWCKGISKVTEAALYTPKISIGVQS
ncbi:uncharacterized protein LOC142564153 isoform X2 [Dermacentor variabilis]|uniref:uncharacterized protein LOC142564153 isoform X2 n=1 Tax=Dermacentor variabilis TaxID=34621 RepID=UPI003F5C1052